MIHSLLMQNWYKHHNRTFEFQSGLNVIRGENEGGKSLILEAIDYALHGSVALRLPVSMYPSNLTAVLETTMRNTRYRIERTPKMATLTNLDTNVLVAKGTKAVDQEVRKILGFTRNVFLVSNYSSQDAINQLGTLKPAERKKVIDNVVGLTAVESVLTEHKAELTTLNRILSTVQARVPDVEPTQPSETLPEFLHSEKEFMREEITRLNGFISRQENITVTRQRLLDTKPEQLHFDEVKLQKMLIPEGIDRAAAAAHDATLASKKQLLAKHQALIASENAPAVRAEPSREWLIPDMTQEKVDAYERKYFAIKEKIDSNNSLIIKLKNEKESITYYKQTDLDDLYLAEKLYKDWQHVQELKSKGSLICDGCGAEVHLMKDHLAQYKDVPEVVDIPVISYDFAVKSSERFGELSDKIGKLDAEIVEYQDEIEALDLAWYPKDVLDMHFQTVEAINLWQQSLKAYEDFQFRIGGYKDTCATLESEIIELELNWYDAETLANNFYAIEEFEKLEKQNASLLIWQNNFDALPEYAGDEAVVKAKDEISEIKAKEQKLLDLEYQWNIFNRDKQAYDDAYNSYVEAKENVDSEKEIIETLQVYKSKIKSSILPSVNAVASSWMQRMSAGKHVSVGLTDDMDILVNGEPIEALSISGRALGHLSLRMALGQVLTNSIYPVFMADEVDASMRNERAQAVLDSLVKMLEGSVKQIIMISHRDLENIQNVIEV